MSSVSESKTDQHANQNVPDLLNVPKVFNEAYLEFIQGLYIAVGKKVSGLRGELQYVTDALHRHTTSTDVVYKRLIPGVLDVAKHLYAKDSALFDAKTRACSPPVGLFEYACIYDVFQEFDLEEKEALWESLQNLTQTIGILASKSKHMSVFTNMARTFIAANPNLPLSEQRTEFMKQMLTNETMKKDALSLVDGNLKVLTNDIVNIVKSQGLEESESIELPDLDNLNLDEGKDNVNSSPFADVLNAPSQEDIAAMYNHREAAQKLQSEMSASEYYAYLASQQEQETVRMHTASKSSKTRKSNMSDFIRYVQSADFSEEGQQQISAVAHAALGDTKEKTPEQIAEQQALKTLFESFASNPTKAKEDMCSQLSPDQQAEFEQMYFAINGR